MSHLSSALRNAFPYLLFAAISGCGDGPSAPPTPVASLKLSRDSATLVPGASVVLSASPFDAQGKSLTRTVSWVSSDPSVAAVVTGVVTAIAPGKAIISATAMTVTSTAEITVKEGAIVGPLGSSFSVAGGAVSVTVPPGAIAAPLQLIIDPVALAAPVPRLVPGTVFSLSANGTFVMPVSLGLRFDPTKLTPGALEKGLKLYSLTGNIWNRAEVSVVDTLANRVFASVSGPGTFAVFEEAPASAALNAPATQSATVGTRVTTTPSIKVVDVEGFPVPDVTVTFAVTSGGGSISSATTLTDSHGVATANTWTLGTKAGLNTLTATVARASGGPLVFSATGVAGPAKQLLFATAPPTRVQSTVPFSVSPVVQVSDEFGNAVQVAGVVVSSNISAGTATLGGTLSRPTDAAGLATFNDFVLTGSSGQKALTFTSPNLPPLSAFIAVTGGVGAAAQLFAGNSQTTVAGTAVPIQPAVRITDVAGDPVAGVQVFFNVASGGGATSGDVALTDINGVARLGSWTLGSIAGPNSLTAVASGLADNPVTFLATGIAGAPASIVLVAGGNQSAPAGRGPRDYVLFRVFDSRGNGVPSVTVNLSVVAGGGTIAGTATSLGTGVVVAPPWTFGPTAGPQRIQATVASNPALTAFADATATTLRIVTFGDSNTDFGYAGNSSTLRAVSYISANALRPDPSVPNAFTQLAGKIESFWAAQYSPSIVAVNHGAMGTSTGNSRSTEGSPGSRTVVNGVTRFGGEVLGLGFPWNGGEPTNASFPGPIARVKAFTPTANDFAYVSLGTNDGGQLITSSQTIDNLNWMIDAWQSLGLPTNHLILTTLPPAPGGTEVEADRNRAIRNLALSRGVSFVDITAYTSFDDGKTWKSSSMHVGDEVHYSESVREWIAQQVTEIMATLTKPAQ